MASNGFTLYAATRMLGYALRTASVYGKLHLADPLDGTMHPAGITTRAEMVFGIPDANGVFDLSAPTSWPATVVEKHWGLSIWDAPTAGNCLLIREFLPEDAKPVYVGDVLTLASIPLALPIVGQ